MQELVANVLCQRFDIEHALEQQLGSQSLPFPGMDKSGSAICNFYIRSVCSKGNACPFRHVKGDRTIVCKHWLRGLCKKGDECEFLHEYDMSKMPECFFFSKYGKCMNRECPFLHIDPESKIKDCAWYDRGFCRHGPSCKNRHVRRVLCQNYLNGFCLDGTECKFMHPQFDLPLPDMSVILKKALIVCHSCGESGHKAIHCLKGASNEQFAGNQAATHPQPQESASTTQANMLKYQHNPYTANRHHTGHGYARDIADGTQSGPATINVKLPIEQVVCFKCGGKGHYANKCPKGHLAFLSNTVKPHPVAS